MPGAEWHAYTLREPVGVVGQIIPWNFPLLMAAWKLGPALASGCTVVLKPAEQTPLSALRLGELILEAGVPDGVLNIVPGYGETAGAALAAHDDVDKVAFTGSTEVGKMIVQAAAGNLKKVTLELGGKSPNVVFADADLEAAIAGRRERDLLQPRPVLRRRLAAVRREGLYDEVLEGVSEQAKKIKVGTGIDPQTEMGPLVSPGAVRPRHAATSTSGREEGAKATAGGDRDRAARATSSSRPCSPRRDGRACDVQAEEIFGPVVTVMPFEDIDEVPRVGNETMYGLAAGIWTSDLSKAHRTARDLRAGTVWVNCYNVFDAALPFGGYKESGWGREMGAEALENYTETKAVCIQL